MSSSDRLYLDHAATTPVSVEARAAMAEALEHWANPSSPHADGRKARAALEYARKTVADTLGWCHDVILTSGASEAIQIVAARATLERRVVGPTEHDVVEAAMGPDATVLLADGDGLIDLPAFDDALAKGPALVAIQLVNNETGVIQPLGQIYDRVRAAGSLLLADCAQAVGKIALPDADFIAVSAHKLGGPPGVGAVLVKDLGTLDASGGQERGYRRGTENLPGAAAMVAALQGGRFADAMPRLEALRPTLEDGILASGGAVIAAGAPRIPTIGAYAMPGVASASQVIQFDLAGISVSAGSACSSGSMKASRVLAAMGVSPEIAECAIRVSFGADTDEADIARFLGEWRRIAERANARAA
ncbi:cysteine desulfurase family protein [Sphingomonas sp. URHD0057]|uniref:cysteine desulfurase family protein n=1 Tax=Sphingomonas sp. URHD0057 TaxID=1380389 RepID=UPI00048E26FB|nr:aminotransferase class V-fold PLP-dependent enzyme [Sphingomonas sp. URHD0057]